MAIGANEIIRIGIIGCGGIANGKHMPSLAKVKNAKMVAFCDIIEERALKAREKYGTPDCAVYTDYKKLLEDKTIDVVHVLTPNRSHSFITVDALEAGKHVMCEKPMAINSAEAQKMLDAAKRTGKKLTIGYQTRHRTDSLYLKQEIEAGTLGDIYYAEALAIRRRAVPTWGVFLNEYEQGGGPLIDIGTHALDLTLWMMDNYTPKYCVGTTYHALNNSVEQGNDWGNWDPAKFTVEDSAFGFVVMENGATVNLRASWALNYADPQEAKTLLCGTKAGADM
ncbi:MAG: Gfo/Idh/MocA family oxidoreductase, partial [Kiritimatiellae bacterium]|nr:Gfo/Idh/MocA family oxidoreductase [Kiritimatiellia bacterium]